MEGYYQAIIIISTLFFSALFSGSEIAFLQSNKLKIEIDKNQGIFNARILAFFIKNQNSFITTLLLGNNIALVLYGIFMGDLIVDMIFPEFVGVSSLPYYILLIQTIVSTLIILITAEFLPKTIFRINPNKILNVLAFPLVLIYGVLFPITVVVNYISNGVLWLLGGKKDIEEINFGRLDLDDYLNKKAKVNQSEDDQDYEVQIFHNALNFSKVKARDCMIPRTEIMALDIEASIHDLVDTFIDSGYSKILIYRDSIDNIIGYVHSFEMFKKPNFIKEVLRPIGIVPESMPANVLLEKFISQKQGISIVVDEFGGTSGLITMEDVVEEIFGEIQDEHDVEELIEDQIGDNTFVFSARHEIAYLNDEYELRLPESDEYETLGGMLVSHFQDIPEKGAVINIDKYSCQILESTNAKIVSVKVTLAE